MKKTIVYTLIILCYFTFPCFAIWAVVEFILYLVKDHPFNWWSVWGMPIILVVGAVLGIYVVILERDNNKSLLKSPLSEKTKSAFQQRLGELAEARKK